MSFKIAYCAGHCLSTPGKRLPKALDPNETREWVLNNRVAEHFARAALEYEGVQLLRTDDPTGKTDISIKERTAKANAWGADLYCDFHHNAAGRVFDGGGVEGYSYPGSAAGAMFRDAIYEAVIAAGGIKGTRSNPLQEKRFDSLRYSNMPAVLMEYGFMDSRVDAPIILTDAYAKLVAYATMAGIAKVKGLKKLPPVPQSEDEGYTREQFVRDVQEAIGAEVDGIPGEETISKTPTVSRYKNRTHAVVAPIQKRLATLGYTDVGNADGIAGPKFELAVTQFQEDNGCWADGELTAKNKTWRCLLGMN
jgi:N-acetylmuramoyl-L-alanine amidase